MFENEHEFKKAIDGLNIDTTPNLAHKERLRGQMLAEFKAACPAATVKPMRSGFRIAAKLAVAAAIVVAAVVGIRQISPDSGEGALILEPVKAATLEMPWMHATITEYRDGGDRTDEQWNDFASKATYIRTSSGFVYCAEYGESPRHLVYNPQQRSVLVKRLPPKWFFGVKSAYTLVDAAVALAADAKSTVRQWPDYHECRAVEIYEIEKVRPGIKIKGQGQSEVNLLRIKLMADPQTKRLVAARVEYEDDDSVILASQDWIVDYPTSGPKTIYDLGVPRTVKIEDVTALPIGTPPDQPRPIGTPAPAGRY